MGQGRVGGVGGHQGDHQGGPRSELLPPSQGWGGRGLSGEILLKSIINKLDTRWFIYPFPIPSFISPSRPTSVFLILGRFPFLLPLAAPFSGRLRSTRSLQPMVASFQILLFFIESAWVLLSKIPSRALAGGREGSSVPFKEQRWNSASVRSLGTGAPAAVAAAQWRENPNQQHDRPLEASGGLVCCLVPRAKLCPSVWNLHSPGEWMPCGFHHVSQNIPWDYRWETRSSLSIDHLPSPTRIGGVRGRANTWGTTSWGSVRLVLSACFICGETCFFHIHRLMSCITFGFCVHPSKCIYFKIFIKIQYWGNQRHIRYHTWLS